MKQRLSFMSGNAFSSLTRKTSEQKLDPLPEPMSLGAAPPTPEGLGGHSGVASASSFSSAAAASSSTPSGPTSHSPSNGASGSGSSSSAGSFARGSGLGQGASPKAGVLQAGGLKGRSKSFIDANSMAISSAAHGGAINDKVIVLRTGMLKKKGVINTGWKKRYFVLTDKELAYYDDEPKDLETEVPKGIVSLVQIVKVQHHSEKSKDDYMFDVITPARVFRLQAESIGEMEAWIATISGTAANTQQHSRKRGTQGFVRDMTEDSALQGEDISAALGGPHQPADLQKWELWNAYDVSAWLQTFGMGKYRKGFYAAGITGGHLKGLSSESLAKLGVEEKTEQIKILSQVQKLMSGAL